MRPRERRERSLSHAMAPAPYPALVRLRWLVLAAPVLALAVALTAGYLWNEDFWWYLSSGRVILETGGLPDADPILSTSGPDAGWVYHSWLWTVIVAGLESLGGLGLVVLFHALVASTLVTLVYTSARVDRHGLANALAALLVLITAGPRLCGKAELATWLMVAVFFLVLDRRTRFTWKEGSALAALQVLWANLHGGYPLGIFVALCYSVGGWIQERFAEPKKGSTRAGDDGERRAARRPPLWYPAVLFAVSVADPRLALERLRPFGLALDSPTAQPLGATGTPLILEWRSPFSTAIDHPKVLWLFCAALGIGLIGFVRTRFRPFPRLLFFAGVAALAATAVRHSTLLAVATALVTLANLSDARAQGAAGPVEARRKGRGRRRGAAWRLRLYPAVCALVGAGLTTSAVLLWTARDGFRAGGSERFFAVKPSLTSPGAVEFVREHDLPEPIFNDYVLGAYLGATLYPERQVFIDSRVLGPDLVERYTRMVDSAARWRRAAEAHGFRTAILGHYSKTVRAPLGLALLRDPAWRLVYVDPFAVIFVRSDRAIPRTVRERGVEDEAEATPVPFVGSRSGGTWAQRVFLRDFPSNYLIEYLANLGRLGFPREVERLADAALAVRPGHPLVLRQRCAARYLLQKVAKAVEDCRRAYENRSEDPEVVWLYATVLVREGERSQARSVLDRALEHSPRDRQLLALRRRLGG